MNMLRKQGNSSADAIVELISQSFRLNSRLQHTADQMARDVGLTGTRWQVLNAVAQLPEPATVSDIARWMGLARQSVQQVANALEKDELIAYQPNPNHRRAPLVMVTSKASKLLAQLDKQRFDWARKVAITLPVKDIRIANEILQAVREKLSN